MHMPIYWGDYLRDTGHLSAAEHGAYLLLLGHYWTTSRPLPDDEDALRRISRMDPKEWARSRATIRAFFQTDAGAWRHKRVDAEMKRAAEVYEKRVKAARTRWNRPSEPAGGDADAHASGHAHACADGHSEHVQPQPHPPNGGIDDDVDAGARPRPPDRFDAATEAVIEAAGADPSKQAGWMTAQVAVAKWLSRGADLDRDVLPAIRAVMISRRNRGPPNSPAYFDRPVIEALESRLRPLPDVTPAAHDGARNGARNPSDFAERQSALRAGLAAAALRRMGAGDG